MERSGKAYAANHEGCPDWSLAAQSLRQLHELQPTTCHNLQSIISKSQWRQADTVLAVQLVATYHCDQAYAFDVTSTGVCTTSYGGFDHSSVPDDDSSSNAAAFIDGEQTDASISAQSSSRQATLRLCLDTKVVTDIVHWTYSAVCLCMLYL